MKKLLEYSLLGTLLMMSPFSLFSLPLANPTEASLQNRGIFWDESNGCFNEGWGFLETVSFRLGFYGDYVFDRHLRVHHHSNHSTIHQTTMNTNALYFAMNLCNRFDLFGTLGATHFDSSTPWSAFSSENIGGLNNLFVNVDTETTFSWSVGFRGTFLRWRCLGIGAEGQYFRSRARLNSASIPDFETYYFYNEERPRYHEWQIGLGINYRIPLSSCATALVPYLGIKWSSCRFTSHQAETDGNPIDMTVFNMENARNFGYAIGMTLLVCNQSSVTVEGRFRDEKAIYVNGQVRF